jgi:hypothetical protein
MSLPSTLAVHLDRPVRRWYSMKVFLSYSFSGEDSDLVQGLERLLSSHNILIAKGRRLGGDLLLPEVRRRIDDSDGLIALKTKRERVGDSGEDRWRSSPWIDYEYSHARDHGKQAVALVEYGVETTGPFESYERIALDRTDPLEAFLALSETLRVWKERIGIHRIVQIRPDELGKVFRTSRNLRCRYRFIDGEGNRGDWADAEPIPQASGTLLYLKGIRDDETLIEVEVLQDQSPRWWSRATSQFISVEMQAWEEGP